MSQVRVDDGCEIAYRVSGNGERNVILVHGWKMTGAVFDDMLEFTSKSGLKIAAVDLRGNGESTKTATNYELKRLAADVMAVADAAGMRKFTLVGHSMGGLIGQWLGAHEPQRVEGLVLMAPVPASGLQFPDDVLAFFKSSATQTGARTAILNQVCKQASAATLARLSKVAEGASEACVRECLDTFRNAQFSDKLASIVAPTLVVSSDDPAIPADLVEKEVAQKIKNARFVRIKGAGHYVTAEAPMETANLLQAFIAGYGARS